MRDLQVNHVSFSYGGDKTVIQEIELGIRKNEKVALVGVTGSGKTTLFKLLNRSYDVTEGGIHLDGIDIRRLDLQALRRMFGMVPQEVFLFTGTLLENIRLFRSDYSLEDVVAVTRRLGIHDWIQRMPAGYDRPVSPRGGNLSMGERQLVAMARGLLFDPPFLLLDEATAHVDSLTLELIQKGLDVLSEDRTVLVAAHRLSTVRHLDRILVFHQGRIVESGRHRELMARKGIYHQLYQSDLVVE